MRFLLLLALAALPAVSGESVILHNGFRLRVDRHEISNGCVRLYTGSGVIEMPSDTVAVIEAEVSEPPPPAALSPPPPPASPRDLVQDAARKYGLPPEFLHSVAASESGYDPAAVSPKGALGIMQLMPATAADLSADPRDPAQNVDAGARYLRDLLLRYDGRVYSALAAYNAGPATVERYQGIPPYRETQLYVQRVIERFQRLSKERKASAPDAPRPLLP